MTDDRITDWRSWIRPALTWAGVCMLAVYLTAYVGLSRRGRAESIRDNSGGFYYLTPENSDAWRFCERTCTVLFWPLNQLDSWLNPEMSHSSEPLMDLS